MIRNFFKVFFIHFRRAFEKVHLSCQQMKYVYANTDSCIAIILYDHNACAICYIAIFIDPIFYSFEFSNQITSKEMI